MSCCAVTPIFFRRDSSTNWEAADPILGVGEPGYDTTTGEVKVGDGVTTWSALSPIGGGGVAANQRSMFMRTVYGVKTQTNFSSVQTGTVGNESTYLQSTGVQGALVAWDFGLDTGTYTYTLSHHRGNNRGIYSVRNDDVEVGTIDGYNAATQSGILSAVTGIVIGEGPHELELNMATRNASSGNFFGTIEGWTLVRTGA